MSCRKLSYRLPHRYTDILVATATTFCILKIHPDKRPNPSSADIRSKITTLFLFYKMIFKNSIIFYLRWVKKRNVHKARPYNDVNPSADGANAILLCGK